VKPRPGLHCSVDLRKQTYTEPVPLKYGKLATNYPWIYGYFYSAAREAAPRKPYDRSQSKKYRLLRRSSRILSDCRSFRRSPWLDQTDMANYEPITNPSTMSNIIEHWLSIVARRFVYIGCVALRCDVERSAARHRNATHRIRYKRTLSLVTLVFAADRRLGDEFQSVYKLDHSTETATLSHTGVSSSTVGHIRSIDHPQHSSLSH